MEKRVRNWHEQLQNVFDYCYVCYSIRLLINYVLNTCIFFFFVWLQKLDTMKMKSIEPNRKPFRNNQTMAMVSLISRQVLIIYEF